MPVNDRNQPALLSEINVQSYRNNLQLLKSGPVNYFAYSPIPYYAERPIICRQLCATAFNCAD